MANENRALSDGREQLLPAVARLEGATYLSSRMSDTDGENKSEIDTPLPEMKLPQPEEPETKPDAVPDTAGDDGEAEQAVATPTVAKIRRRSRPRLRPQGPKEMKSRNRQALSPIPSSPLAGDSSPNNVTMTTSPIKYHIHSRTPSPTGFDPTLLCTPSSPSWTSDALFENLNLYRSNSARRMVARHKPTGGIETYDPALSPSPTSPLPSLSNSQNALVESETSYDSMTVSFSCESNVSHLAMDRQQNQLYHRYADFLQEEEKSVDSRCGDQQGQTVNHNQLQQMQQQSMSTEELTPATVILPPPCCAMVCAI
jgi:serine/arginine repetitive matrix protein 2